MRLLPKLRALGLVLAFAASASAAPIADSFDDWSADGVQGENSWFNGYYNLSLDDDSVYQVDDFIPFTNEGAGDTEPDGNHWTGEGWDLLNLPDGPWTSLGQEGTHPNGVNSAPNDEHWTIRRYVAPITEPQSVALNWSMAKQNLNGGNGVTGILFVNGQQVDTATIAANDGEGVNRNFYVNLNPNDVVDLALTPNGADGADGSINRLTIDPDLPDGPLFNFGGLVANSQAQFSQEQGQDGWSYGYYDFLEDADGGDGVYSTDEFIPFLNDGSEVVSDDPDFGAWQDGENHWDGTKWDLLANAAPVGHGPWTQITADAAHPASNGQDDEAIHWAVRRWESSEAGEFEITGALSNGNAGGDGVVGRIFVDGEQVWSAWSNGSTENVEVSVNLSVGSIVDFVLDPDGAFEGDGVYDPGDPDTLLLINDGNDGTTFTAFIGSRTLFIPLGQGAAGDFDGDGELSAADIDALSEAVRAGANEARFDVNSDGLVNDADRSAWVVDLKNTFFGDSNLDGEFNSGDFVTVFTAGEYEDDLVGNSTWATGDWNNDLEFNSSDLVSAFSGGGFETGPRASAAAAVPEPSSLVLATLALCGLLGRGRNSRR